MYVVGDSYSEQRKLLKETLGITPAGIITALSTLEIKVPKQ
jgi:hypothetical protein